MRASRAFLVLLLAAGCASRSSRQAPPGRSSTAATAAATTREIQTLRTELARFAPVSLTADLASLPEREREVLMLLIAAARLLDPVYDRQVFRGNPALAEKLAGRLHGGGGELDRLRLDYFRLMRGPWDRQDHHRPFAIDRPRPPGAGFYPEDLSEKEFRAFIAAHPEAREALESPFTVVYRDGDRLAARPYSQEYARWLEPAAARLEAAASRTENRSLARFLRSRAAAFRSNDYYQSDKDWMDLDSRVEVTIGPYETYEDELAGLKAAFAAFVTISDPEASRRLALFKELLPAMEQNLPVPAEVKTRRGAESPIRVVDLVFAAGDARKSVLTIAFNLPNDERVRAEKGSKKVLLRNAIKTKFTAILQPIGERLVAAEQRSLLDADAFFHEVLFHELSHSLGPAFVGNRQAAGEVKNALGASAAPLEEGKADVMGAYNLLFLVEKGHFPREFRDRLLVTYFAGLFRSVRFGTAEAHGKGAALQLNRFLEEGAARHDESQGTFRVDLARLEQSIEQLVRDICLWQHHGDKAGVDAVLARYGTLSPTVQAVLARLTDVPVDVRPAYPTAGER
jgi:hypothetical protein